jgi:glycosyltransferase involved in cell wall biosynthesis
MTGRQVAAARRDLPSWLPVVKLRVGIDTCYYARSSTEFDVPEEHRAVVDKLLQEPYVILPGDELRLNEDALEVVKTTGLKLVRISQYGTKSGTNLLKEEVARRGLSDRVIVFEHIPYVFLRFLLQHALAYVGFVDSNWQPAGWTVACESLASGLPLVIYDGLTARELADLHLSPDLIRLVDFRDRNSFGRELMALASAPKSASLALSAREFAARVLDAEATAAEFGRDLVTALAL